MQNAPAGGEDTLQNASYSATRTSFFPSSTTTAAGWPSTALIDRATGDCAMASKNTSASSPLSFREIAIGHSTDSMIKDDLLEGNTNHRYHHAQSLSGGGGGGGGEGNHSSSSSGTLRYTARDWMRASPTASPTKQPRSTSSHSRRDSFASSYAASLIPLVQHVIEEGQGGGSGTPPVSPMRRRCVVRRSPTSTSVSSSRGFPSRTASGGFLVEGDEDDAVDRTTSVASMSLDASLSGRDGADFVPLHRPPSGGNSLMFSPLYSAYSSSGTTPIAAAGGSAAVPLGFSPQEAQLLAEAQQLAAARTGRMLPADMEAPGTIGTPPSTIASSIGGGMMNPAGGEDASRMHHRGGIGAGVSLDEALLAASYRSDSPSRCSAGSRSSCSTSIIPDFMNRSRGSESGRCMTPLAWQQHHSVGGSATSFSMVGGSYSMVSSPSVGPLAFSGGTTDGAGWSSDSCSSGSVGRRGDDGLRGGFVAVGEEGASRRASFASSSAMESAATMLARAAARVGMQQQHHHHSPHHYHHNPSAAMSPSCGGTVEGDAESETSKRHRIEDHVGSLSRVLSSQPSHWSPSDASDGHALLSVQYRRRRAASPSVARDDGDERGGEQDIEALVRGAFDMRHTTPMRVASHQLNSSGAYSLCESTSGYQPQSPTPYDLVNVEGRREEDSDSSWNSAIVASRSRATALPQQLPSSPPSSLTSSAVKRPTRGRSVRFCEFDNDHEGEDADTTSDGFFSEGSAPIVQNHDATLLLDCAESGTMKRRIFSDDTNGDDSTPGSPKEMEGRLSTLSACSAADDEPQIDQVSYLRQEVEDEAADADVARALHFEEHRRRLLCTSQHAMDLVQHGGTEGIQLLAELVAGEDDDDAHGLPAKYTPKEIVHFSDAHAHDLGTGTSFNVGLRDASPPMRERSLAPAELIAERQRRQRMVDH